MRIWYIQWQDLAGTYILVLFLAQIDGGNDIKHWMALRKFGFTRDGGFGSVFVDDLEQNGGQNVDLGEISILEGSNKLKNVKTTVFFLLPTRFSPNLICFLLIESISDFALSIGLILLGFTFVLFLEVKFHKR